MEHHRRYLELAIKGLKRGSLSDNELRELTGLATRREAELGGTWEFQGREVTVAWRYCLGAHDMVWAIRIPAWGKGERSRRSFKERISDQKKYEQEGRRHLKRPAAKLPHLQRGD